MELYIHQNFNSYFSIRTDITYYKKIDLFVDYLIERYGNLGNITAICLTEFVAGSKCRYLEYLEMKLDGMFDVIPPQRYDFSSHPRALLTVLCINRVIKYSKIDYLFISPLANRVNCVRLWPSGRKPLRLVGLYMPQTKKFFPGSSEKYKEERKELNQKMWCSVFAGVDDEIDEDIAIFGDLQEGGDEENIKFLKEEFGFRENNGFEETDTIADYDHFLLKGKNYKIYHNFVDISLLDVLSDHPMTSTIVM